MRSDLKILKSVWSKTDLGKQDGRLAAVMIHMMMSDRNGPPWAMKKPMTSDIGRKVEAVWGDEVVQGKLIGYDSWGMASVIKGKRGTLWIDTSKVQFVE
jgi:hypothetical protein